MPTQNQTGRVKYFLAFLWILALAASVYGMTAPYPYWKNCLATGSCLAALVLFGGCYPRFFKTGFVLLLGLAFSMAGDYFMKEGNLVGGIGLFGLGHISFLIYFLLNGTRNLTALTGMTLLFVVYIPYFLIRLLPGIENAADEMKVPHAVLIGAVGFYLVVSVLSFASALTFGSCKKIRLLAACGIACIIFSDTLIAENLFCHEDALYVLMMPTYLATHFLLMTAAMFQTIKNDLKISKNNLQK